MSYQTLYFEVDGRGVAYVMLNRPEKHNAMNAMMMDELEAVAQEVSSNNTIRVMVLAAKGKTFCAGGDLQWMQLQAKEEREGKVLEASRLTRMLYALDTLNKPLIACVQGPAYGGGVGLLSVCDTVLAYEGCTFALTETRLGLIPAIIGPYVIRCLGETHARSVFMNGKVFNTQKAWCMGLVSEIVTIDKLATAVELEVNYYLQCAPGAVTDAKKLCLTLARGEQENPIEYSIEQLVKRWESEEAQIGIDCFFEKAAPPWLDKKEK